MAEGDVVCFLLPRTFLAYETGVILPRGGKATGPRSIDSIESWEGGDRGLGGESNLFRFGGWGRFELAEGGVECFREFL
jgi:hypothetical protein